MKSLENFVSFDIGLPSCQVKRIVEYSGEAIFAMYINFFIQNGNDNDI